jgi:malate dehydrogenase (oxaloacetate-decarboxylating)(NADP+)
VWSAATRAAGGVNAQAVALWSIVDDRSAESASSLCASGSPFPTCVYEGKTFVPGQGNNAYIFPGVGLGVVACEAKRVTDRMFAEAAKALAEQILQSDLDIGRIYPLLKRIQEVSAHIASAVVEVALKTDLAGIARRTNILEMVKDKMWRPVYQSYVFEA